MSSSGFDFVCANPCVRIEVALLCMCLIRFVYLNVHELVSGDVSRVFQAFFAQKAR